MVDEQRIMKIHSERAKKMTDRELLETIYITQRIIYEEIVDDLKLRTAKIMRKLELEP